MEHRRLARRASPSEANPLLFGIAATNISEQRRRGPNRCRPCKCQASGKCNVDRLVDKRSDEGALLGVCHHGGPVCATLLGAATPPPASQLRAQRAHTSCSKHRWGSRALGEGVAPGRACCYAAPVLTVTDKALRVPGPCLCSPVALGRGQESRALPCVGACQGPGLGRCPFGRCCVLHSGRPLVDGVVTRCPVGAWVLIGSPRLVSSLLAS